MWMNHPSEDDLEREAIRRLVGYDNADIKEQQVELPLSPRACARGDSVAGPLGDPASKLKKR
jgi:hypothetical protein